jgi:lipopolysaccharide transport system ATP-binding protein
MDTPAATGAYIAEIDRVSKRLSRRPRRALVQVAGDLLRELDANAEREERLRAGEFWALRDVTFSIQRGEVIGLVGANGAGKSTLINLVAGVLHPTAGRIIVHTDSVVVMDNSAGMSMAQTGRENIGNKLALYGFGDDEIAELMDDIIDYFGMREAVDAPVGTYSTGMRVRLALSLFSRLRPDFLIIDEALGGGDMRFRMKFRQYLRDYIEGGGSILLASHDTAAIQSLCHRAVLLHEGTVSAQGEAAEVVRAYEELMGPAHDAKTERPIGPRTGSGFGAARAIRWARPDQSTPGERLRARIEEIEVVGANGAIRPNECLEARIRCRAQHPVDRVFCIVAIGRGDVLPLAVIVGGIGNPLSLVRGETEMRFSIARLPLLPGRYDLYAWLTDAADLSAMAMKGVRDRPVSFVVEETLDPSVRVSVHLGALLQIDATWELVQDEIVEERVAGESGG